MSCVGAVNPCFWLRAAFTILVLYMSSAAAQQLSPELDDEPKTAAVKRLLQAGRQALRENDGMAAVRAYREALRLEPNAPEALYQLAIYNFRRQDYVRAFELIRRAVEVTPRSPYPRLALAKGLSDVGEYEEAVEHYERALETADPESRLAKTADLEMNMLKFKLAARDHDRGQVLEFGRLLTRRYSTTLSVLETVASVYVRAGYFDEARDVYFNILRLTPDNPQVEFHLGKMYETMRDPSKAVVHYQRAIDKGRGTAIERMAKIRAALMRATLSMQEDDKEGAHKQFLKVLELDETNVFANMHVANHYQELRKLELSKEAYLRVIEVQPDNMEAHFRLALSYLDSGDTVNGVRQLDLVLSRLNPDSPMAQTAERTLDRVQQRFKLDVIRRMIADEDALSERLRNNPDDVAALTSMGDLMARRGRKEEALEYFERAMKADRNYADAFLKAAQTYDDLHNFAEAKKAYEQALTLVSDDAQLKRIKEPYLMVSGNYFLDEGELVKAEENFTRAYEMAQAKDDGESTDMASMLWGLAMVNSRQGDLEDAADWYEELIALVPSHVGARINAAFVYEQMEEEEKASAHYNAVRIANNAPPAMKERAERRLDYIRRQTNGFSYGLGYVMGLDDNLNSTQRNKFFEYRSNLYASAIYRYKLRKGMKLSVNISPSYVIYHRAEYDFFNFTISPNFLLDRWGYDWSMGLSRNTQSSVLRPERSSTVSDSFNMDASWVAEDDISYSLGMDYRGFGSTQNPFFDSHTVNLNFNVSQPGPKNTYLSYGYSLTVNNNKNSLGNDYAYTGHGVRGRMDKRVNERMTAYLSGNLGGNLYHNADSSTNFQHRRRTFRFGFGGGLNYHIDSWVSFFASYNYSVQHANLPVGFIFNELQSVEGRQSTSLGSFVRHTLSAGLRMNF